MNQCTKSRFSAIYLCFLSFLLGFYPFLKGLFKATCEPLPKLMQHKMQHKSPKCLSSSGDFLASSYLINVDGALIICRQPSRRCPDPYIFTVIRYLKTSNPCALIEGTVVVCIMFLSVRGKLGMFLSKVMFARTFPHI